MKIVKKGFMFKKIVQKRRCSALSNAWIRIRVSQRFVRKDLPVVTEKKITLNKRIHMAAKQRSRPRKADRKAPFRKLNLIQTVGELRNFSSSGSRFGKLRNCLGFA